MQNFVRHGTIRGLPDVGFDPSICDNFQGFIKAQHMFFVATAPLGPGGHVNVSPKGLNCLRILSPTRVAYLDLTGSGNETAAHITQNGRITLMFCSFEGSPMILRVYGTGKIILREDPRWAGMVGLFDPLPGARQIIDITVHRVQPSCGQGVPLMAYQSDRTQLPQWQTGMGESALAKYRKRQNRASIDGLPIQVSGS